MSHALLDSPNSSLKNILLIAADYAKLKLNVELCGINGLEPKLVSPEHVSIEGYLPALIYICRKGAPSLLGNGSALQEALVYSMLFKCDHNILTPLGAYTKNTLNSAELQAGIDNASNFLQSHLDPLFLKQTFAVGERITIADIVLACSLYFLVPTEHKDALFKGADNVARWYNLITNTGTVKNHLNSHPLCSSTSDKPDKKSSPLDELPESTFILDAWKRQYSNDKNLRECSMPWFWNHFDPKGYSLWYMRYEKTEGENVVDYATANMLSGFLQRLDNNFRKYSFAVLNVIGEKGNFDIQGVWLIRGNEIPNELKEHPSFQYYEFKRLNQNDTRDKALIEDYWCNDDVVEGRSISSCKVWK